MSIQILQGDCREVLKTIDAGSVQVVCTSPPYFGLRRYLPDGDPNATQEIGSEETPSAYVAALVDVFRQVWRVLRVDGTCWLNLGDSYANDTKWGGTTGGKHVPGLHGEPVGRGKRTTGLKSKDLIGIPWRVAFALQEDGWWLRSDIIWNKPNVMPESVCDRPTRSHEYLFLLTKSERYFYDADAIREDSSPSSAARAKYNGGTPSPKAFAGTEAGVFCGPPSTAKAYGQGRNKRSVWTIPTSPYPGAHFATFPEALVEPCILAGSSAQACEVCGAPWERNQERQPQYDNVRQDRLQPAHKGPQVDSSHWRPPLVTDFGWQRTCAHPNLGTGRSVVLDPFFGSGTVGRVALKHGRDCIGIELNQQYVDEQAMKRTNNVQTSLVGQL